MFIKCKLDSDSFIKSSGVNYVPFHIAYNIQDALKSLEFIEEPIGIREKGVGGGKFIFNMTKHETEIYLYRDILAYPIGIYHDMFAEEKCMNYQGEIQLHEDGTMCGVYCETKGIKNREACTSKEAVHFGTYFNSPNILSQVSWDYKPVRYVVDYLCKFSIVGPVVEYSYYSVPVGINNENIIIWEVRNY